jgi:hypothetical protein
VAETEDDLPIFDDDIVPHEEPVAAAAKPAAAEAKPLEPEAEATPAKAEKAEKPKKAKKVKRQRSDFDDEFGPKQSLPVVELGVAIAVPVVCIALAVLDFVNFSTALLAIGIALVALMAWMGRRTNTLYTVALGCILISLITSVYCLWTVLAKYHYDVKATEARQGVTK